MNAEVKVDAVGRIEIPKSVTEALGLAPGDVLQLESNGKTITLRPAGVSLTKQKGIWVLSTGEPMDASVTDDLLREIRTERDLHNAGLSSLSACVFATRKPASKLF